MTCNNLSIIKSEMELKEVYTHLLIPTPAQHTIDLPYSSLPPFPTSTCIDLPHSVGEEYIYWRYVFKVLHYSYRLNRQ